MDKLQLSSVFCPHCFCSHLHDAPCVPFDDSASVLLGDDHSPLARKYREAVAEFKKMESRARAAEATTEEFREMLINLTSGFNKHLREVPIMRDVERWCRSVVGEGGSRNCVDIELTLARLDEVRKK